MTLFHINPLNGGLGICHDSSRKCPLGKNNHFTSLAAVSRALEVGSFTKGPDEETSAAYSKLKESFSSPLVDHRIVARFQETEDFGDHESALLVLLGKTLLLEESSQDGEQSRADKEELLGEISDAYFIRKNLSSAERIIVDNLVKVKDRWLKNWI